MWEKTTSGGRLTVTVCSPCTMLPARRRLSRRPAPPSPGLPHPQKPGIVGTSPTLSPGHANGPPSTPKPLRAWWRTRWGHRRAPRDEPCEARASHLRRPPGRRTSHAGTQNGQGDGEPVEFHARSLWRAIHHRRSPGQDRLQVRSAQIRCARLRSLGRSFRGATAPSAGSPSAGTESSCRCRSR